MAEKTDIRTGTSRVGIGASIFVTTLAVAWSAPLIVENAAFAAPRVLSASKGMEITERVPIPCDPTPICPPLDVVFIVDTSGSMGDEAAALCEDIVQVIAEWNALGIAVKPWLLGITETPGGFFDCLTDDVVNMVGGDVPVEPPSSCAFPGEVSSYESWGAATAIVAEQFAARNLWTADAVRVIVPISDEGPCNGSFPEGCDEADDHESIANAIATAVANDAIVSPICGTSSNACVIAHAEALAAGTGGIALQTEDPKADLAAVIYEILQENCEPPTCDDEDACTLNDRCIDSVCVGDTPEDLLIPCTDDGVCPDGWLCNLIEDHPMEGLCDCGTSLCVELDEVCYVAGETFEARVAIGAGSDSVSGAQFLFDYDPTCLEFQSIDPCSDSIFTFFVTSWADEVAGRIWFGALVDPSQSPGTTGPHDIACIQFKKLRECDPCGICLIDENPYNTLLVDSNNRPVPTRRCGCSEDILLDSAVELACPQALSPVDAEPGRPTATITWNPVTAVDTCAGPVEVECTATHLASGEPIVHLTDTSGIFPVGTSEVRCEAANVECGSPSACDWRVFVEDQNCVQIDIQLGYVDAEYPIAAGPLERCIEFEFYTDCVGLPEVVRKVITFGGIFNDPGWVRDVLVCVPPGKYACVTARDPLHTLRSTADMEIDGNVWRARFIGDPQLGGNWLRGGNLDGDRRIDILDLGIVRSQYGETRNPNTTCETPGPHADINGDGMVDAGDEGFVTDEANWLAIDKLTCCAEEPSAERAEPVTEISIDELRRRGLGRLGVADTNGDGVLNTEDFAYPMPTPAKRQRSGGR